MNLYTFQVLGEHPTQGHSQCVQFVHFVNAEHGFVAMPSVAAAVTVPAQSDARPVLTLLDVMGFARGMCVTDAAWQHLHTLDMLRLCWRERFRVF